MQTRFERRALTLHTDLNHSNAFWRHCAKDTVDAYQKRAQADGRTLEHNHICSDGYVRMHATALVCQCVYLPVHRCAGQFKQCKEATFLIELREQFKLGTVTHSYFASCHGKGPSDSEGAAVKCALRAAELRDGYFASTAEAHEWLVANLTKAEHTGPKKTHTIGRRSMHLVPLGAVNHSTPDASAIPRLHALHYMSVVDHNHVKVGAHTHVCSACMGAPAPAAPSGPSAAARHSA